VKTGIAIEAIVAVIVIPAITPKIEKYPDGSILFTGSQSTYRYLCSVIGSVILPPHESKDCKQIVNLYILLTVTYFY